MAGYGKSYQNMDFKWQLARKIDRLDLGSFAALEFYYRNAIIFGIIRAMDPEEDAAKVPAADPDQKKPGKSITDLITSIDSRIDALQNHDTTALLMGKMQLAEVKEFQRKTISCWYEIAEVVQRCKLTDQVRVQGEEI